MKLKSWIVWVAVTGFTIAACNNRSSSDEGKVLKPVQMQRILWDLFQADAFTESFIVKDSSKNKMVENAALQQKIFDLHKVSRQDFKTSYDYYSTHPAMMRPILDSITAYGERQRNEVLQERYSGQKAEVK